MWPSKTKTFPKYLHLPGLHRTLEYFSGTFLSELKAGICDLVPAESSMAACIAASIYGRSSVEMLEANSGIKRCALRWVRLAGIKELGGDATTETQFLWSIAQVLLWQLELARQPAVLRHLIFSLPSFFYPGVLSPFPLSLSLSSFVSLVPFVRKACFFLAHLTFPLWSHLTALFLPLSFTTFPWAHSLQSSFKVCANPPLSGFPLAVGWRGSSSLHPLGSAPDPAALSAGGESRQERFPIP